MMSRLPVASITTSATRPSERRQRLDAEAFGDGTTRVERLDDPDGRSRIEGELRRRQADRPKSHHQDLIVWSDARAAHAVGADAKRLDECELVVREARRGVQEIDRHGHVFLHPAVDVNAVEPQVSRSNCGGRGGTRGTCRS
jgi:hypothetical protein